MHTPALLKEAIDSLGVVPDGKYIDATYGEGGYSREILKRGGKLLAIDWDAKQISNLKIVRGNFAGIEKIAKENNFYPVQGVIFDLGLSYRQIDESGRGFSYKRFQEPLDMRISPDDLDTTAADLIKEKTASELYDILARNSEEVKSKIIAEAIKRKKHVELVGDLISAIDSAVGYSSQSVYARIFQALRIEVNHEFENLKKGLEGATRILTAEGRIVVVSFHSVEDRIVKNFGKRHRFKDAKPYSNKLGRAFERSAKIRTIIV